MDVSVDLFGSDAHFLADSSTPIKHIFNIVAKKLKLNETSYKYFGLHAYNDWEQCTVLLEPSDQLLDAINKGLRFTPVIRLFIRANSFPANFDELKKDSAAMKLFFDQTSERWYKGYSSESSVEIFLLVLHMLIKHGSLDVPEKRAKLLSLATSYVNIGEAQSLAKVGHQIEQLWRLFGKMSADDAIFNYMNILSCNGFPYETVRFSVKNYAEKKPTDIEVNFQGIEFYEFGSEERFQRHSVPWSCVRDVSHRKEFIIVKLFDESLSVLKYRCHSNFMAKCLYTHVASYHRVYLQRKLSPNTVSSTQLELSNPGQFFDGILANLMAPQNTAPQSNVAINSSEPLHVEVSDPANKQLEKIVNRLDQWMKENQDIVSREAPTAEVMFDSVSQLYSLSAAIYENVMPIKDLTEKSSLSSEGDEGPTVQVESEKEKDQVPEGENSDIVVSNEDNDETIVEHSHSELRNNLKLCASDYSFVKGTLFEDYFVKEFLHQQWYSSNGPVDSEAVGEHSDQADSLNQEDFVNVAQSTEPSQADEIQVDYFKLDQIEFETEKETQTGQEANDKLNLELEEATLVEGLKDLIENKFPQEHILDQDQLELLEESVANEEGEVNVDIKPEYVRRRRFAKLRLSLFEH